jgi:hypothetical protein
VIGRDAALRPPDIAARYPYTATAARTSSYRAIVIPIPPWRETDPTDLR